MKSRYGKQRVPQHTRGVSLFSPLPFQKTVKLGKIREIDDKVLKLWDNI